MAPPAVRRLTELTGAVSAGIDPVKYFRKHAADRQVFCVTFPGLGRVSFTGTSAGARDVLLTPATAVSPPKPNPIEPVVGPDSMILQAGAEHRVTRSRLTPAFHGEQVKSFADLFAAATRAEIAGAYPGRRLEVRAFSTAVTLRVIIRVVFGIEEPVRRRRYTDAMTSLLGANSAALMLMPALRRNLGGHGPWAHLMALRDDLDRLLTKDIESRRHHGAAGYDIMDLLLSATDESGRPFDEAELLDQFRTVLAAGHETSAAALAWALYHIYTDEHIRAKLEYELSTATTVMDIMHLSYLSAVIKETLRMHPPVPIVVRRLCESRTVAGTDCAPGSIVAVALYALHHNPDIWDRPDQFDPERFLLRRYSAFEYAPFGGGYRRCVGASFASIELAVTIATIMRSVDLRVTATEMSRRPPGSVARGIAVAPDRDIELEVMARR